VRYRQILPLLVASLFAAIPSTARAQSSLPPVGFHAGQKFPEVVLPSMTDGQPMSVTQFRGKKVILHIFASW
jgi:hypothetical protein